MKTASGELVSPEAAKPPRHGWPMSRWLLLIALVLGMHVTLIFMFGARKTITPRPVTNVPKLELANGSSEWLALNDPTLFALPNREGFAWPPWLKPPGLHVLMPDWTKTERLRWLELSNGAANLGAAFNRFMQTNRFASFQFVVKPPPHFAMPVVPLEPAFARTSTLRIEGNLAKRPLVSPMKLPSVPYDNVLQPSEAQVLVNAAGEVVSAVLLSSSGYTVADEQALALARAARFAPAAGLTIGQLTFDWRVIAPPATNAPAGS